MTSEGKEGAASNLGRTAARGAAFTMGSQVGRIALQVVSVAVLARLLTPTDYGLVTMVLVVAGVADVFRDFGLSSAAVQARALTVGQRDNLFWLNTAIGALIAAVLAIAADLIARLFGHAELAAITRVICVVFILNGMATQYRASLLRDLRFKTLGAIDLFAPVVAFLTAIALAFHGWGYWALVGQMVCLAAVTLLLLGIAAGWLPNRYQRAEQMSELVRFGWQLFATQLIRYSGNNTDSFVIGLRFGAGVLGVYSRAFQLLMNPVNQLRTPITTVAIPTLSRLQDHPERFFRFVLRGQVVLGYTIVAALGIAVSGAEPLVGLLLGPQWMEATPVLRLLAVAAIFQTLAVVGYWIYVAKGETKALLQYTIMSTPIRMTLLILGSVWGMVGVAGGYAAAAVLLWPVSLWWVGRRTPVPTMDIVRGVTRLVLLCAVAAVIGWITVTALEERPAILQLGADILVTMTVYALGAILVPRVRRDMSDAASLVRMLRRDRRRIQT